MPKISDLTGLSTKERAEKLIESGYVKENGKPNWTQFYTDALKEQGIDLDDEDDILEADLHEDYNKIFAPKYSQEELDENWEDYLAHHDNGSDTDELNEFIDKHGLDNLDYYGDYTNLLAQFDQEAVDAFIEWSNIDNLDNFQESYQGTHKSKGEFVEDYYDQMGTDIPTQLVVDWEETWDYSFRFDFYYDDATGAVFRSI